MGSQGPLRARGRFGTWACPGLATALTLVLATGPAARLQQAGPRRQPQYLDRIAPYVPTPPDVVQKMLELAQVSRDDRVYDLGSGDGRIVIMAAQKFGAEAVGVELNADLVKQSAAHIAELGLEKRARILQGDIFETDVRRATVVTLYLLTIVNERLRPQLERQLRSGARVVSHDFRVPGWKPEKVVEVTSENHVSHTLYLYVRP